MLKTQSHCQPGSPNDCKEHGSPVTSATYPGLSHEAEINAFLLKPIVVGYLRLYSNLDFYLNIEAKSQTPVT